jgi:phage terminase large subunit-like protein
MDRDRSGKGGDVTGRVDNSHGAQRAPVKLLNASRGKGVAAEPVASRYAQAR